MSFNALLSTAEKTLERVQRLHIEAESAPAALADVGRQEVLWETKRNLDILAIFKEQPTDPHVAASTSEQGSLHLELCTIIFDIEIVARSLIRKARGKGPHHFSAELHPSLITYLRECTKRTPAPECTNFS